VRTTGPGQSALLLLDAVDLLVEENVDYAVVGAMAASVHGVVRASFDADAVLMLTVQQVPDLEKQFVRAGFQTQLRRGDSTDPIPALLNLTDSFRNRVDLLIGLRGLEAAAFARAIVVPFKGVPAVASSRGVSTWRKAVNASHRASVHRSAYPSAHRDPDEVS
jgi:hypothetical protein